MKLALSFILVSIVGISFGQNVKSGFGSGLGLGLGFEIINSIFDNN
jgi:galactitol-specific phosphotransferase system IIC component